MANATLIIPNSATKIITVTGKDAANTAVRPISNIAFSVVLHPTFMQIAVVAGNPQQFTVKNINTSAIVNDQINWTATNELGNTISGSTPITLQAADPAVSIETTYSDPA